MLDLSNRTSSHDNALKFDYHVLQMNIFMVFLSDTSN